MDQPHSNRFLLFGRISYRSLKLGLRGLWKLRGHAEIQEESTYLDTFDWRLHGAGTVLEAIHGPGGWRLEWRNLGETMPRDSCSLKGLPRFVADIGNPAVRNRLAKVIGVRALLPLVRQRCRRRLLQFQDAEGKNFLSLQMEKDTELICIRQSEEVVIPRKSPTRVKLLPLKGYAEAAEAVRTSVLASGRLQPVSRDPLLDYLHCCGISAEDRHPMPVTTSADTHADTAIKLIQLRHFEKLRLQEEGIRQDIDPEFLHDYRVAVRRTRALLRQSKGVLHAKRLVRFKQAFASLGHSSGIARDMDVHIQALEQAQAALPTTLHDALLPVQELLRRERGLEYDRLRRILDSRRYRDLCQDWQALLLEPYDENTNLPRASLPVIVFAGQRIWKTYRKARRQGLRLDVYRDSTRLHRLRKTIKKLRYLIESFHYLYPQRTIRQLVGRLKALQDNLGVLQDYQVQRRKLEEIRRTLGGDTGMPAATLTVLDHLIARLNEEDKKLRRRFAETFKEFSAPAARQCYRRLAHE